MYSTNILLLEKYDYLKDRFRIAYNFLKRDDLAELAVGQILLDGQNVIANVQQYDTSKAEDLKFEAHNRYFDIQYVISGQELIGMVDREKLTACGDFDERNDVIFYKDPEISGNVLLLSGDFVVIAPEEAHKPRCIAGESISVKKIVLKVRV
jgi:biofilm protein TabA